MPVQDKTTPPKIRRPGLPGAGLTLPKPMIGQGAAMYLHAKRRQHWAVLAEIDAAEAFTPITSLEVIISAATVFIGLVAVAFGIRMSRSLTTPISALTHAARQVGAGIIIEPLASSSRDELGEFTEQFNEMASNLHQQRLTIDRRRQKTTSRCSTYYRSPSPTD